MARHAEDSEAMGQKFTVFAVLSRSADLRAPTALGRPMTIPRVLLCASFLAACSADAQHTPGTEAELDDDLKGK